MVLIMDLTVPGTIILPGIIFITLMRCPLAVIMEADIMAAGMAVAITAAVVASNTQLIPAPISRPVVFNVNSYSNSNRPAARTYSNSSYYNNSQRYNNGNSGSGNRSYYNNNSNNNARSTYTPSSSNSGNNNNNSPARSYTPSSSGSSSSGGQQW